MYLNVAVVIMLTARWEAGPSKSLASWNGESMERRSLFTDESSYRFHHHYNCEQQEMYSHGGQLIRLLLYYRRRLCELPSNLFHISHFFASAIGLRGSGEGYE
jgi:hypothetical protein